MKALLLSESQKRFLAIRLRRMLKYAVRFDSESLKRFLVKRAAPYDATAMQSAQPASGQRTDGTRAARL